MVIFTPDALKKVAKTCFTSLGALEEEAEWVADCLVEANLVGADSHGTRLIPHYMDLLKKGAIKPGAKIEVVKDTPAATRLDGNYGWGYVIAKHAMELAVKKAKKTSIAMVGAYHCNHMGRQGRYPLIASDQNMIGIAIANTGAFIPPYMGRSGCLGSNPISCAVPTWDPKRPFLLDMATSVHAGGFHSIRASRGVTLHEGWKIDVSGKPTIEPGTPGRTLPVGGPVAYKGYGLACMVEWLTGMLFGQGASVTVQELYNNDMNDITMIAINIENFVSIEEWKKRTKGMYYGIKDSDRLPEVSHNRMLVSEILLPGEPEWNTKDVRLREGIYIEPKTWDKISQAAKEAGVDVKKLIKWYQYPLKTAYGPIH